MRKQSFWERVEYFERRAKRLPSGQRRRELELAAEHYRALAQASGEIEPAAETEPLDQPKPMSPRRQRLVELFRGGPSGASKIVG